MHIKFTIHWSFEPEIKGEMDVELFHLLNTIRNTGTLRESARSSGYSYRHAWGLIKRWENSFQTALVKLERGRKKNAVLTAFAEKLIALNQLLYEETGPNLDAYAQKFVRELEIFTPLHKQTMIRLFASHGMAITHFNDLIKSELGLITDFQIHGSLESLRLLSNGYCDIAGFHVPQGKLGIILAPKYKCWLMNNQYRFFQVAIREQGLILQQRNVKRISGIKDLTKRSVRFINRQKDSGTRTIFDQLLMLEGIRPARINGYSNEEFTHIAVAALIASGDVDAGFGIKAAAARFKLHFIPILKEKYFLAVNSGLDPAITENIRKLLGSRKFRQPISKLDGYDARHSGKELEVRHVFA